jgi:DNA-binding MarR family transcriptional regulator
MNPFGDQGGAVDDGVAEQIMRALRRIIRAVDLRSRFLVNRYGLTGPQLVVLRELSRQGEVPAGELTKAVHLSQATVTGIIDRLEKRGLVHRGRSERDKRCVLVRLTPTGRDVLTRAPPLLHESFVSELNKLRDWERTQILSSLQRVVSMMEAKDFAPGAVMATESVDARGGESAPLAAEGPAADGEGGPKPGTDARTAAPHRPRRGRGGSWEVRGGGRGPLRPSGEAEGQ